jgi:hypothetical protein
MTFFEFNSRFPTEQAVISDDFSGYNILDKKTKNKYLHFSVNHSLGQYSAGNGIDTNGIESFWSLVKREYIGTHHHYSVKYMQHYINEMAFRQNNRKNPAVFETLLGQTVINQPRPQSSNLRFGGVWLFW